ncbi:serine carboxypeptidase-like 46 [Tasmannia lanceolata]|uniref:serine carboxypeptidase-like 46 n=1 Tax=Tasmannia lanceolata TaxID=3420 RepID=UPI004063390E
MAWVFFFFQAIFFLFFFSKSCAELITTLPGQPSNTTFNQYSGYIVTNTHDGRALFYYFVEANVPNPLSRPLTLWLNGGPGCSSLGFGAFMEHGPFQVGNDALLIHNKYSWNLESNMLYVETPIGVGFSYSNTSENYINWNDTKTAAENLRFIVNWFEEFPKYRNSDLYLTGESYAGHYIPQIAALLVEYNKQPNNRPIKLKAIALGNPLLDLDISVNAGEYLWSHGAISDETLLLERTVCNDSRYLREHYHDQESKDCTNVFNKVHDEISIDIDSGDLLLPLCLSASGAQQPISKGKHGQIQAKLARIISGDPCLGDRIFAYLNLPQVQRALHASTTHLPFHWDFCSGPLVYQKDNLDMDLIPLISYLLKEGIPIMLYSGDQDTKIPLTQTRIIANKISQELKLVPFTKYGPWKDKEQVGGWAQSFGELRQGKNVTYLTYATVRGGAHEVPFTSPSQALTLFRAFLKGSF